MAKQSTSSGPTGPDATSATDAGADTPGPRIIVERPPPGLARGKYAWPAWGIGVLGGIVLAVGVGYWVWRLLRSRRK